MDDNYQRDYGWERGYDDWKTTPPDTSEPRPEGCVCTWEPGDSPCPVHGEDEGEREREEG